MTSAMGKQWEGMKMNNAGMDGYSIVSEESELTDMSTDKRYRCADGTLITDGAELFNYYDCVPVTVRIAGEWADPTNEFHDSWDGWFRTSGALLNGDRMCSLETARARGYLK